MKALRIYTQIPGPYVSRGKLSYEKFIKKIIFLTDKYNFNGSLIYYNHYMADPWILASYVLEHSFKNIPIIAVQPNAIPPHTAAKAINSLTAIYGRKVNINLITGNSLNEIQEINDILNHDERYGRLKEYIECLQLIFNLKIGNKVNYEGKYYKYTNLYTEPLLDKNKYPEIFLAGSSSAALELSQYIDVSLTRPGNIKTFKGKYKKWNGKNIGIRLGIIARETSDEAWQVATDRFPKNRIGKIKAIIQSKSYTTVNNREIASYAIENELYDGIFWLGAYLNGNNNNPYLVGSYKQVALYLKMYMDNGVNSIFLPNLYEEVDFKHTSKVVEYIEGI